MGYQEYVCKIDNISKFVQNKYKADDFIDNKCFGELSYSLVEFKEDFNNNIKKGLYIYVFGERTYGSHFLFFLRNNVIGRSRYAGTIESALDIIPFSGKESEDGERLKQVFKEKSTPFARVVYEKQIKNERERSLY